MSKAKDTRRSFLKKAALGTIGTTMAMKASSYSRIIGANDRLNLCFMGLGRRVDAYYPALAKENNVRLAYLCDVKKSQVTSCLEALPKYTKDKPAVKEDIREILEDSDLDVVFVATPDHWHAKAALLTLDAGKHVYLEKPCAHNPLEEEALVAKQKSTGKLVQMGNQQRSSAQTIEVIEEIKQGKIGRPYKAIAFYNNKRRSVEAYKKQAPPGDLNWELFQGPAPRQDYYHDIWNYNWHWYGWQYGTAETGNNAIHELDIARWALGVDYPGAVSVNAAKQHYREDGWTMYDTMYATFHFDDNREICWDGKSRNGYQTYGLGRGTLIYGSEGSVLVDRTHHKMFDRNGVLVKEKSDGGSEGGLSLGGGGSLSTAHVLNLFDGIRNGAPLRSPIDDGVKSNHMALLANISYRIGEGFDVDTATGKIYNKEAMKLWGRAYEPGWEIV